MGPCGIYQWFSHREKWEEASQIILWQAGGICPGVKEQSGTFRTQ